MQQYEMTLIFKPELTEEKADAIIEALKLKVIHRVVWGKRLFSYPIQNYKEGLYIHLIVELTSDDIKSLEKDMKLQDSIIRHLLVRPEKEI